MPFSPIFGFGDSTLIPLIFAGAGLIFTTVLFVLIGIELKWELKGVLLLVMLAMSSGLAGIAVINGAGLAIMGGMTAQVSIKEAVKSAGFQVFTPKHLPKGLQFQGANFLPGLPGQKMLALHYYSASGHSLEIMQSKDEGINSLSGATPGRKSKEIKIKGKSARVSYGDGPSSSLFLKLDNTCIDINTSLSKDEIIKVAESLERQ